MSAGFSGSVSTRPGQIGQVSVAVGHSLLVTGYHLITRQTAYEDLGGNYFDERDREAVKRRAVCRLEELGYRVEVALLAAPAG